MPNRQRNSNPGQKQKLPTGQGASSADESPACTDSERRFRALIEQMSVPVFCYEHRPPIPIDLPIEEQVVRMLDGVLVECNMACAKAQGANHPSEVIGRSLSEILGDREHGLRNVITQMVSNDYRMEGVEGDVVFQDGTRHYFLNSAYGVVEDGLLHSVWGSFKDITEQKNAERTLRESEQRFSTIFQASPMAMALTRLRDGHIVNVNQAWSRTTGYEASEAIGKPPTELDLFLYDHDRDRILSVLKDGGRIDSYEFPIRQKSGDIAHVMFSAEMIQLAGEWYGLTLALDITDRKRTEQELIESENKFRSITENASDSIFIKDQQRRYTFVNKAMLELLDLPEDSVLGKTPADVFGAEQAAIIDELDDRTFAGETVDETRTLAVGEHVFHFHTVQTPLTWDDGTVTSIMGVVRDVTQPKMAENELRAEKARYQMLFESANDFVILSDLSDPQNPGPIIDASQLACERLGYTRDEIRKLRPIDIVMGVDHDRYTQDAETLARDQTLLFDRTFKTKSGGAIPVEIHSRSFEYAGRRVALTIGRDISRRKKVLEDLRRSEHLARTLLNATSEMALLMDEDGVIIDLNDAMAMALHETREVLLGQSVYELLPPEVAKGRAEVLKKVLQDQKPTRYIDRSRGDVDYESSVYPLEKRPGERQQVVVFARDITEQSRAERRLRESEERFRALFESSPDLIAVTDLEGNFLDINRVYPGYERDKVIGSNVTSYLSDRFADDFRLAARRAVETGQTQSYEPDATIHGIGTVHWLTRVSPLRTRDKVDRLILSFTDITDRKMAESALQQARLFTDNLISTASVMIVGLNREGNVTLFNPAGERLTGYSSDEIMGKNWFDLLVPKSRYAYVYEHFQQLGSFGLPRRLENPILTKDGQERIISWSNSELMEGNDIAGTISFGIDITERIESERKMRELNERLEMGHEALLEKNIALKQILAHIDQDKSQYKHEICDSIEKLIKPVIGKLERTNGRLKPAELAELRASFNAILQKDIDVFASNLEKLSPRELDVLNLIKAGRSSKEIADRLNLSLQTVHKHRGSIRNKLQLSNKEVNLAAYLRSHAKGAAI